MGYLRELVKSTILPDDIIKAILSQINGEYIYTNPDTLHSAFYNAKETLNWPQLDYFIFDISSKAKFSDELYQVLTRLEVSGILPTLNPAYDYYDISRSRKYMLKSFEKYTPEDQEQIKKCAQILNKHIVKD